MIRKSLFWGLTLVLVVAIINLIVRGRKLEKEQASKDTEVVQQSKPTSTRVFSPQDLTIVDAAMQPGSDRTARHRVQIRHGGAIPYGRVQLKFVYLDSDAKVLATKTHAVTRSLRPGASVSVDDIIIPEIPESVARAQVSIIYADLETDRSEG